MKGGVPLIEPSEFGRYLKAKRTSKGLTQEELAESIGKTGQYISNIEKGKNNAPPNSSDIEKLIIKLNLQNEDASEFRRWASADRNRLSSVQMTYLFTHKSLMDLIDYGIENEISDSCWKDVYKHFLNIK